MVSIFGNYLLHRYSTGICGITRRKVHQGPATGQEKNESRTRIQNSGLLMLISVVLRVRRGLGMPEIKQLNSHSDSVLSISLGGRQRISLYLSFSFWRIGRMIVSASNGHCED